MDLFANLFVGLGVAVTPYNLLYCFIGVLLGTLIGVLPGIGPVATIAMLLPTTYALSPVTALIMLAGIYYGAQYGGSTSAILIKMPGETSSVVTCLDGYEMARRGRAGVALATAALASFFAGTVATVLICLFSPPLAQIAMQFGAQEYCALMVLGLIGAVILSHGSLIKALAMIVLGLLLGIIGTDINSGVERFTFGVPELSDGIGVIVVAMGVFGIAEIVGNLRQPESRDGKIMEVNRLLLSMQEVKAAFPAALRGTGLGSLFGLLPGGGAMLSSFASYAVEKRISSTPEEFGKGAIAGVAGPEAANNAGAQTSFIPLLTLGIPENAVMAIMLGAMTIHGIQLGPRVMTGNPELFWGLIVSMWVGNLMLLVLNLPLIGMWVRLLRVPYRLMFPAILVFCAIGVYSVNNSSHDIAMVALLGLFGVLLAQLECEPAPLLLGFVLGPMFEEYLRRAMLISRGDWSVFVTSPISATLLAAAAILLVLSILPAIRQGRELLKEDPA